MRVSLNPSGSQQVYGKGVLSPILFTLVVNDLPASIAATNEGVQFGDSTISSLLYADDLVMIADSEQTLQTLLGKSP